MEESHKPVIFFKFFLNKITRIKNIKTNPTNRRDKQNRKRKKILYLRVMHMNKNSLKNLIKGGKPKLKRKNISNIREKVNLILSTPLPESDDRLTDSSYKIVTIKNIKQEIKPWPTIINKEQIIPFDIPKLQDGRIKDICKIDEQATINLISKNRVITTPKIREPTKEREQKKDISILDENIMKLGQNLKRPIVPIFNISLAKIIDPEPLALTWALVNQKW